MQSSLLRHPSGPTQASQHSLPLKGIPHPDHSICDQGRELPYISGGVQSSSSTEQQSSHRGRKERTHGESSSSSHPRRSLSPRSRSNLSSLCDDPSGPAREIPRIQESSSSTANACQGPTGHLQCSTCRWALFVLQHSACYLAELDDFQSFSSTSSDSDVGEDGTGCREIILD